MTTLNKLKQCKTLGDLARLLNVEASALSYRLYVVPESEWYDSFSIPKKAGGVRLIHAPNPKLKFIQNRLAECLSLCLSEIDRSDGVSEHCVLSHGFIKSRSIITNARRHRNRRWVFNADLKDFFPSLNFGRVRGFFIKNRNFKLDPKVATIIAQISCHNGVLPQGSPCSPVISNLMTRVLDVHLNRLARVHKCTYTRYADDITFSTNLAEFPRDIAVISDSASGAWAAGEGVRSRVHRAGFSLNPTKARMSYRNSRQLVTGLVANRQINPPAEFYKTARAMCSSLFMSGKIHRHIHVDGLTKTAPCSRSVLRGYLAHIYLIKHKSNKIGRILNQNAWPNYYKLHRYFLDYVNFYDNDKICVLTEGKTDIIYMQSALHSLNSKFPTLYSDGKTALQFLRNTDLSSDVQHLSGGSGDLSKFINQYASISKRYKAAGQTQPVIIILDDDEGAKEIKSTLKNKLSIKYVGGKDDFYHVVDNLYVIFTPNKTSSDKMMEDLFGDDALKQELGGKKFEPNSKKFDNTKHYGKDRFASQIVAKMRDTLDFSGFKPLIKRIVKVQEHYQKLADI